MKSLVKTLLPAAIVLLGMKGQPLPVVPMQLDPDQLLRSLRDKTAIPKPTPLMWISFRILSRRPKAIKTNTATR